MPVQSVVVSGGINTESAIVGMKAGEAVSLLNTEVDVSGSYTTMDGIEKFDGRSEPNKSVYQIIKLASVAGITIGATLTAAPSGWSAKVCGIDWLYVAVIAATGTLTTSDTIGGVAVTVAAVTIEAQSYALHKQFRASAQSILRASIGAVPGVGPVRGVVIYKGDKYAFRDHSDGTTCRMYKATTSGWTEITTSGFLLKNGRYEFRVHNFKASAGTQWLIIVNGVNKAVKYDGATCVQLNTAMPTDTPSGVEVLPSSVLLLSYDNGSVMTSKIGDPTDFTVGSGGTELGMSDKIIGMALQPDEKVAIFCEKSIKILAGKTPASFAISTFNPDTGAIKGSIANIGDSLFVSQGGLTRLSRSQAYGSFEMSALDKKVKSLISINDILFTVVARRKNQYRLFTQAGFVGFTFSGSDLLGSFVGSYPTVMNCGCSGEISGEEYILLGGTDGFVYRADVGQSHAGAEYPRLIRLAWNDLRMPQQNKKFKRLVIHAESQRVVDALISVELDYSSGDSPRIDPYTVHVGGNESYYGTAIYGKSVYGVANDAFNQAYIEGVGRSIAVIFNLNSSTDDPIRFGGYSIEYMPRAKTR